MFIFVRLLSVLLLVLLLGGCLSSGGESGNEAATDGKGYTIGGRVDNLVGEGLVLELSDSNQIKLNRRGEFTFPESVLSGNTFEIVITQQPIDPIQKCRFNSASRGVMPVSNVESVRIICEFVWSTPKSFNDNINPDFGEPSNVQMVMNSGGDALIVWLQSDGSNKRVYKSEYRSGKWEHPADSTDSISISGSDAHRPKVAMSENGLALIVWHQIVDTETEKESYLLKSEYLGGGWSHPTSLDDRINFPMQKGEVDSLNPEVALNNKARGIIVWKQNDGERSQVYKAEVSSKIWTLPKTIDDHISLAETNASSHKVVMNNEGEIVVIWLQSDDTGEESKTQQLFVYEFRNINTTNPEITKPKSLDDNVSFGSTRVHSPQVAIADDGHTVIVWAQSDGEQDYIFKRQFWKSIDPDTKEEKWIWYEVEGIDEEEVNRISLAGAHSTAPAVAVNDNGEAVIAWETIIGVGSSLFQINFNGGWSSIATPQSSFTHELTSTQTSDSARAIDLTFANNGSILFSWLQRENKSYQRLMKGAFTPIGGWVIPSSLEESVSFGGRVASESSGETLVFNQIITCEDPVESVQTNSDNELLNHTIQCAGINNLIHVDGSETVLSCEEPEIKRIEDDNQIVTTTYDCDGVKEKIYVDGAYKRVNSTADEYTAMGVINEGRVGLAENGNGVIAWVQETDTTNKLFISELRTESKTSKYPISGTVVGLAGNSLSLENTKSDELIVAEDGGVISKEIEKLKITENGSFFFGIKLKENEKYDIKVTEHPSGPLQNCNVQNATGVVGKGSVTNIYITCENVIDHVEATELIDFNGAEIIGATISDADDIYIVDRGNSQIIKYQSDGTVATLVDNLLNVNEAAEILFVEEKLYFVNSSDSTGSVYEIDLANASLPVNFGDLKPVISHKDLLNVVGIAADSAGTLYATTSNLIGGVGKLFQLNTNNNSVNEIFDIGGRIPTLDSDQEFLYIAESDKITRMDFSEGSHANLVTGLNEVVGLFYKNESIYYVDKDKVYKLTPHLSAVEQLYDVSKLAEVGNTRVLVNSQNKILLLVNDNLYQLND